MRKYRKIFMLTILFLMTTVYCTEAYAAADILFQTAQKLASAFKSTKGIILVVGGFGLVGVAYFAIFGKVKWSWLAGLLVGLAVLSAAGGFLYYATQGGTAMFAGNGDSPSDIFKFFSSRAVNFAVGLRNVAFSLAGFGIIMFTFLAITGKINFKHLGYIFISLFMLSGVGLVINYWTGGAAGSELGNLKKYASPYSFTRKDVGDTFDGKNSSFGE